MGAPQERLPIDLRSNSEKFKPGEVVVSHEQILSRIDEMAAEIAPKYVGKKLMLVVNMTGGLFVGSQLALALNRHGLKDLEIATVRTHGYGKEREIQQEPIIKEPISLDPRGRELLFVDDIGDTGLTQVVLKREAERRRAKSVSFFNLFSKPSRRVVPIHIDHVGFIVHDEFLLGFGMGDGEADRALSYVTVAAPR